MNVIPLPYGRPSATRLADGLAMAAERDRLRAVREIPARAYSEPVAGVVPASWAALDRILEGAPCSA